MNIKSVLETSFKSLNVAGELWIVNYFKQDIEKDCLGISWLRDWDIKNCGVIRASIDRKELKGKLGGSRFYGGGHVQSGLLLIGSSGSKNSEALDVEGLKCIAALGVTEAKKRGYRRIGFYVKRDKAELIKNIDWMDLVSLFVEGISVGDYRFDKFKGKNNSDCQDEDIQLDEVKVCFEGYPLEGDILAKKEFEKGIFEGLWIGRGISFARDMVNCPGNECTPSILVDEARTFLRLDKKDEKDEKKNEKDEKKVGITVEVLEKKDVQKLGMGLLLGVASGSDEPLKLLTMHYKPKTPSNSSEKLALVGKGVTFDTGGISLKPSNQMHEMKGDMAGGVAVIGAMGVISALDLDVEVFGIVPMTENMPSGKAIKPGDIIKAMNGKSVEILNTDAEGRLILADVLSYVVQKGCTKIIDVATLTGACVVALGEHTTGLLGNQQGFIQEFMKVAKTSGERVWQLPLFKEYHEQLNSEVADLANIGGRYAGASTAAAFLESFVDKVPWIHLDIAGPSWNAKNGYYIKGGTGVMVSSLVRYVKYLDS